MHKATKVHAPGKVVITHFIGPKNRYLPPCAAYEPRVSFRSKNSYEKDQETFT